MLGLVGISIKPHFIQSLSSEFVSSILHSADFPFLISVLITNTCKALHFLTIALLLLLVPQLLSAEERGARTVFADLIVAESNSQDAIIEELAAYGDQEIADIYQAWRVGGIFLLEREGEIQVLQRTNDEKWLLVVSGAAIELSAAEEEQAEKARPSRKLRKKMKGIIDTLGLKAEDPSVRIDSAMKMGRSQSIEFIPTLKVLLEEEPVKEVQAAFREAIALSELASGDPEVVLSAVNELTEMKSIASRGFILKVLEAEQAADRGETGLAVVCEEALAAIEKHIKRLEFFGSFFRGFSTGSVLLIVCFGLAITFGLMGIINMAHGEFVAIGGYVTFMLQNVFIQNFGLGSDAFGLYLLVSLPVSFLVAAVLGLVLEKTVIRFLYARPLESLLCTWGLSMVMQQGFRLIFGAANVQVNSPGWLIGNLSFGGFQMSYTRLFIILLAIVVAILTWLLLRKTNLGLHIRAVMQNRNMASSLGIPVARVNSMTFALGCGLAALGGAALSQIGNVGPSMGQAYIVDSFMVVVIGSVGNLLGAGLSAMGIGMVDQLLQPALGPVMGKITVFFVIILFLQWRPGGLFPTRSRSLED